MNIRRDTALLGTFVAVLGYSYINIVCNCVITSVIGTNSLDTLFQLAVTIGLAFASLWVLHFQIPKDAFFAGLILGLIIGYTALFYPENYSYMSSHVGEILFAFSAYVVVRCVNDVEMIKKGLQIITYFAFASGIFLALTMNGMFYIDGGEGVGYMIYGYKMLPSAVLSFYFYGDTKKKHYLIMTVISAMCILMFGSRGALVSLLCFIALKFLFIDEEKNSKKIVITFVTLIIVLMLTNEGVILFLNDKLSALFGYNSRTLELLIGGNISNDSGRNILKELGYQMIKDNWLIGAGPYADRTIVHPWSGSGHYIHNFILEITIAFGIPLAVFILYKIIKPVLLAAFKYKGSDKDMVLILFSLWFWGNMFSDTFWTNPFFYATIAMSYTLKVKNRKNRYEEVVA